MSGRRLTSDLLRRAHLAAVRHSELADQITEAFRARYGRTHSDVDCDDLIDALDYGQGSCPTLADADAMMEARGVVPLANPQGASNNG